MKKALLLCAITFGLFTQAQGVRADIVGACPQTIYEETVPTPIGAITFELNKDSLTPQGTSGYNFTHVKKFPNQTRSFACYYVDYNNKTKTIFANIDVKYVFKTCTVGPDKQNTCTSKDPADCKIECTLRK